MSPHTSPNFQGKTAADHPYAPIYAAANKVVVSRTLESADWPGTTIVRGDLATEVEKLKREGDGYMVVTGRSGITRSLLYLDFIDEFRIAVFPFLAGRGGRQFDLDDVGPSKTLYLVDCLPLTNGVVILHYRRRR